MSTKIFYIIASGSPLTIPRVEKLVLTEQDEEFLEEEFDDFDDYVNYTVDESRAVYEQGGCQTILLTEKEYEGLKEAMEELS